MVVVVVVDVGVGVGVPLSETSFLWISTFNNVFKNLNFVLSLCGSLGKWSRMNEA